MVTSAPLASRTFTTSLWPFLEAAINGVIPSCGIITMYDQVRKFGAPINCHVLYQVTVTCQGNVYTFTFTDISTHLLSLSRQIPAVHLRTAYTYIHLYNTLTLSARLGFAPFSSRYCVTMENPFWAGTSSIGVASYNKNSTLYVCGSDLHIGQKWLKPTVATPI